MGSGGPEGKTLFGRHVYRWNYNIKMDLKTGLEGVEWIKLLQDRDK